MILEKRKTKLTHWFCSFVSVPAAVPLHYFIRILDRENKNRTELFV